MLYPKIYLVYGHFIFVLREIILRILVHLIEVICAKMTIYKPKPADRKTDVQKSPLKAVVVDSAVRLHNIFKQYCEAQVALFLFWSAILRTLGPILLFSQTGSVMLFLQYKEYTDQWHNQLKITCDK